MNRLLRIAPLHLTLVAGLSAMHAQQSTVPPIAGVPPAVRQAAESIDSEKIRAHVKFLADDLLEGRGPGKRGAELAAKYIAAQFALDGLKPAGDNGTYFQKVPLYAVHTVEDQTTFSFVPSAGRADQSQIQRRCRRRKTLPARTPLTSTRRSSSSATASMRRNTSGTTMPGVDVKGKVLLVIVNEPPSDRSELLQG